MRCLPSLLVVITLLIAGLAPAQDQKQLDDLKALFEKDPAAGFVEAERLFEGPKREGDLGGMMGIIAVVKDWSARCTYAAPLCAMAAAALPVATAKGNWSAVGDIHWANAPAVAGQAGLRQHFLIQIATEAYAKAGREPESFTQWKTGRRAQLQEVENSVKLARERVAADFPENSRALALAALDALDRADDAEVTRLLLELVSRATSAGVSEKATVAEFVGKRMWVPGADALVPILRQWMMSPVEANPPAWAQTMEGVLSGIVLTWDGRQSSAFQTFRSGLDMLVNANVPHAYAGLPRMPLKCIRFNQLAVADAMTRVLLQLPHEPKLGPYRWHHAFLLIHPESPSDLRRGLIQKQLEYLVWAVRGTRPAVLDDDQDGFPRWRIAETAPEADRATWCLETAYQIADYAPNFPTAASRSRAATEAAAYFDKAGRADLATQAREMAAAFAADDPKVQMQVALAAGQTAASAGKWEDLIKGLEPILTTAAPSGAAVQAALLVQKAQASLGKKDEAAQWLGRAEEILGRAKLPASERATVLVTLAGLTSEQAMKISLLKHAEVAATEAGLEPLQEKISGELAELALATGDLATAQTALEETIARLESKREALAFDRLLRQQWFADNLGPYRKLLWVAAKRNDPAEALWVAEKMRARALTDQLAWQKVDMQIAVAPEIRQRLAALREARNKAYALLQRAMGGEQLTGADIRGAYLPIRGAYLPLRGLGDQPVTEADLKELRGLLEALAKEETALASAVREQVPAYAMASDAPILTGTRLIEKVVAGKDMALLHYTLCDEGLVAVGIGPGSRPKVALIPLKGEDLWQQIGKFRQLIWERKPEAIDEAAKLYNQLIFPVGGCLYGAKRVWIVADGALQLLPFGALIGTDRNYVVAKYAVANTPSLTLAFSSRGQRQPGQGTVILAAPDTGAITLPETDDKRGAYLPMRGMYLPVRGAYMPLRGEGVSTALTAMAMVPLPGAKAEGEALAAQFSGSTLLTDKQATKARLVREGSTCDLLHIATHGYADPDYPEFSGLLTAGEREGAYDTLTAQEVYMWNLRARLVTLSACQTAMGRTVEGEGVMGLTRAFLYAGAQDVLCTLWPVADESTKALMTAFYANLKTAPSIEEALRLAQATLAAKADTRHPFFWAGFVAVRGPE